MTPRAILLGGFLAGVLINVSGISLAHFVLGPDYVKAFVAHLPGPPSGALMARHLLLRFVFGLVCVFLYAALRPGFGGAAVPVAAGILFLASYLPLGMMLREFGILQGWRFVATMVWGAGEALLATLAGAFVYLKAGGG